MARRIRLDEESKTSKRIENSDYGFSSVMLAPNELADFKDLKYPCFLSCKYDGIRMVSYDRACLSRSAKLLPNKPLIARMEEIGGWAYSEGLFLDGEVYDHELTFRQHTSIIMSHNKPLSAGMRYHLFDVLYANEVNTPACGYAERFERVQRAVKLLNNPFVVAADTLLVKSAVEADKKYQQWLKEGYEGAISRAVDSPYKWNRATVNEATIFKHKVYEPIDGVIIAVHQRKRMKAEFQNSDDRGHDELGRPKRTHKAEHYESVEVVGSFDVEYIDAKTKKKVTSGVGWGRGFDMQERAALWATYKKNPKDVIGKHVTFLHMPCGGYDEARHGLLQEFRPDLD